MKKRERRSTWKGKSGGQRSRTYSTESEEHRNVVGREWQAMKIDSGKAPRPESWAKHLNFTYRWRSTILEFPI